MRQMKEEECGKELWTGGGYRGKRKGERDGSQRGGTFQKHSVFKGVKVSTVK